MSSFLTLTGNLTRDPEIRFANNGKAFCAFSIADNRNRKNASGEWEKETSYFDCVIWDESAENFANSFTKGNRVIVTGRLQQRTYQAQDGSEKQKVELVVDEIGATIKYATVAITKTERPAEDGDKWNRKDSTPASTTRFEADFGDEPF